MTDLKALAEAATLRPHLGHHAEKLRDAAIDAFRSAATPDAIRALYAERDEARKSVGVKHDEANRYAHRMLDEQKRAEAAEASLAAMTAERDEARKSIEQVADVVEPHWRGAGLVPTPEWLIAEWLAKGRSIDAADDRAEAAEASLASVTKEVERLREALERLAELTPSRANARDARDLHLTVKAIAETALTTETPHAE